MGKSSFLDDLLRYIMTRVATWPHTVLVAAIIAIAGGSPVTSVFVIIVVVELRLWDDLSDRIPDRNAQPPRVLVHTKHGSLFEGLAVTLGAFAFATASAGGVTALLLLGGCHALLASAYDQKLKGLVQLKYPLLLAAAMQLGGKLSLARALAWCAALYAAVVLYDQLTTPTRRPDARIE